MMRVADELDRAIDAMLAGEQAGLQPGSDEGSLNDGSLNDGSLNDGSLMVAGRLATLVSEVSESPNRAAIRRDVLTLAPARVRRRLWMIAIPAAASLAFSGVAVAAGGAHPGDALYPIRRGIDAVRVALVLNDSSHAKALLGRAERDLADARSVRSSHALLMRALDVFDGDIANARSVIAGLGDAEHARLSLRADVLAEEARALREGPASPPKAQPTPSPEPESQRTPPGERGSGESQSGTDGSGSHSHTPDGAGGDHKDSESDGSSTSGSSGSSSTTSGSFHHRSQSGSHGRGDGGGGQSDGSDQQS